MDQTFGPKRRADVCKDDRPLQTYICVSLNEEGTMEVGLLERVQAGMDGDLDGQEDGACGASPD